MKELSNSFIFIPGGKNLFHLQTGIITGLPNFVSCVFPKMLLHYLFYYECISFIRLLHSMIVIVPNCFLLKRRRFSCLCILHFCLFSVITKNVRLYFHIFSAEKKNEDFLFVTYTIIQNITSSEICALHLTHPSARTPGAVGSQRCGARRAVGGSVPCSRVSTQSWTIPAGAEIQTHNHGLQVRRSIH